MQAALMRHYNGVARTLEREPERYAPVLEVVEGTEEVLWQPWIIGFAWAMALRLRFRARVGGLDVVPHDVRQGLFGHLARLAGFPAPVPETGTEPARQRPDGIVPAEPGHRGVGQCLAGRRRKDRSSRPPNRAASPNTLECPARRILSSARVWAGLLLEAWVQMAVTVQLRVDREMQSPAVLEPLQSIVRRLQ